MCGARPVSAPDGQPHSTIATHKTGLSKGQGLIGRSLALLSSHVSVTGAPSVGELVAVPAVISRCSASHVLLWLRSSALRVRFLGLLTTPAPATGDSSRAGAPHGDARPAGGAGGGGRQGAGGRCRGCRAAPPGATGQAAAESRSQVLSAVPCFCHHASLSICTCRWWIRHLLFMICSHVIYVQNFHCI